MVLHLSEQQISAVVAGEKNADWMSHLQTCADCRQQVEQFRNVLGAFRGAVHEWSDRQPVVTFAAGGRTRAWALVRASAVAVLILLAVLAYRFSSTPVHNGNVASPVAAVDSDALLLDRVKADVSRSTPPGMETLLVVTTAQTTTPQVTQR